MYVLRACVRLRACLQADFVLLLIAFFFSSGCAGQLAFQSVPRVSYEMSPHLRMIHPLKLCVSVGGWGVGGGGAREKERERRWVYVGRSR